MSRMEILLKHQEHFKEVYDSVAFVFDLSRKESFINLRAWLPIACQNVSPKASLSLFGNKTDLVASESPLVSKEEVLQLADSFQLRYFEVSAQKGSGIAEALRVIVTSPLVTASEK